MEGDDYGEAYTTIMQGEILSSEIVKFAEAEAFALAEGNMCGPVMRGTDALPESETSSRLKGSCRNRGDLAFGHRVQFPAVRIGKTMSRSR